MKIISIFSLFIIMVVLLSCTGKEMREHLKSFESKDEIVILIFGDEISYGGISEETTSWGNYLKPMLSELFHKKISLINSSIPGENYSVAYRRIQEDILSYRPDIVFVMLGMQDMLTAGSLLSSFKTNVYRFYAELKESGTFVIIMPSPGFNDVVSRDDPRMKIVHEFNRILLDASQIYSYPFFDIANNMENVMLADNKKYKSFFRDFYLLSNAGNKYVADFIYKKISSKVPVNDDN